MPKVDVQMTTDPNTIIQRLEGYGEELQKKGMTAGLSAAAKPVKDRMKQLVPVRRNSTGGALRKSIGHVQLNARGKAMLGVRQDKRAILVGPVRKVYDPNYKRKGVSGAKIHQGYKAYWLEYTGTEAHTIPLNRGTRRKVLRFNWYGLSYYTRVHVKGMRKRPFIKPAVDQTYAVMGDSFYKGIAKRLDKFDVRP